MDLGIHEKIAVLVLALMLLAGGVILSGRKAQGAGEVAALAGADKVLSESARVNINTAPIEELTVLPGVGRATALRIAEYRSLHGPFTSADELSKVKGLGGKKLYKIKPHIKTE